MEEDEDELEREEVEKKQAPPKVEEKKKFAPPAPRQKTKAGDYIVTKINVKEKKVEHHHEGKVMKLDLLRLSYSKRRRLAWQGS